MRRKKKEKINKNNVKTCNCMVAFRGAGVFLSGGANLKKKELFLLKRHCQQKQILIVMLQFKILVDMIEFQFNLI